MIITGANGAGKSHLAARMGQPVVSFDALKLTTDWVQRPRSEIEQALAGVVAGDRWILEGGPSLLATALPRADAVIWLDPPLWRRAWRLAVRPWRHRGRTRAELPDGNIDRVRQQYRFAWHSLRRQRAFDTAIAEALSAHPDLRVWRCRTERDVVAALRAVSAEDQGAAGSQSSM